MHMGDWQDLINKLRQFNAERDWAQFHNAKDLALALSIEAAELNELFLWQKAEDADPRPVYPDLKSADTRLKAYYLSAE